MYKSPFNNLTKRIALAGLFSTMTIVVNAKNTGIHTNQILDTVTKILTENPSNPSADSTKYNISVTESFIKSRNHFSELDSKSIGDIKSISLNVEANNKWAYGLNYLYSKTKFEMVADNRIERSTSHDVLPYGTYFFNSGAFLTVLGGGRFSPVKINQNSGVPASGKTRVGTGILGSDFGIEKDFGLWSPSINLGVLYENEKTHKYTLSDGTVTNKQWIHFLMGQAAVELGVNIHENFQPYVRTGYQSILRRSTSYTIQNWYGWLVGGGVNLFSAEKWNTSLDYEYNKTPKGDRQSSWMLKLAVSF